MIFGLILMGSVAASALMPPHVNRSLPKPGDVLQEPLIRLYGYSLSERSFKDLVLTERAKTTKRIPHAVALRCKTEGKGDSPGCKQFRCVLTVTFKRLTPGARYELRSRLWKADYRAAPAGAAAAGKSAPRAAPKAAPKR